MTFKVLLNLIFTPFVTKKPLMAFLFSSIFVSSLSHAQIKLDVSGGEVRGIPTAVVPFKFIDAQGVTTDVASIISNNLVATGKFDPINPDRFLAKPSKKEEVRYKDWRFIDAEVLIIGEIWKLAEDSYEIQYRMFDVAREKEIGNGETISSLRGADLRLAAHVISDKVYSSFTGRPGAFYSKIAYIKRQQIGGQSFEYKLLVADWDGHNSAEVFKTEQPLLSPSWSPDGTKIAFVSFSSTGSVVQTIDLSTGATEVIASFKGINSAPSWSPDGTKLAYSSSRNGSPDVYVYTFATKKHKRINEHFAIDTEPAWTPEGDGLLFTSSRSGKPQIYAYRFSSGKIERITFEGDDNANGSLDFDGQNMVLVHEGGKIAVQNISSGRFNLLTNAQFDESPSFSPNGDMVLYSASLNTGSALVVASTDGRVKTRLENLSGDIREPAWSPLKK